MKIDMKVISGAAIVVAGLGVAGGLALATPGHKQPTQQIVRQVDQAVTVRSSTPAPAPRVKAAKPADAGSVRAVKPKPVEVPAVNQPANQPADEPVSESVDPTVEPPQDPPATLGGDGNPLPTLPPLAPPISMNPAPPPEPGPGVTDQPQG